MQKNKAETKDIDGFDVVTNQPTQGNQVKRPIPPNIQKPTSMEEHDADHELRGIAAHGYN